MNNNVVVVGYGSIGQRHANILDNMGCNVSIVSRRELSFPKQYSTIQDALEQEHPIYVVIANETSAHKDTLIQLEKQHFQGKILVEKPIFNNSIEESFNFNQLFIGYNLRFHPVLVALKEALMHKEIYTVQAYVGQYLPSWRPGSDYTKSYSSKAHQGGGVLRDLSHELDYLDYLFGSWETLTASGGKFSNLKIDSDDSFGILYKTQKCPLVTLQLNYLDFIAQRTIIVNTENETYKADLVQGTLQINEQLIKFDVKRNGTYIEQHKALLYDRIDHLCDYQQGLNVLRMIEAVERASRERIWVYNG